MKKLIYLSLILIALVSCMKEDKAIVESSVKDKVEVDEGVNDDEL